MWNFTDFLIFPDRGPPLRADPETEAAKAARPSLSRFLRCKIELLLAALPEMSLNLCF
jgi:hypothetical protein